MKGLESIPRIQDLEKAYDRLLIKDLENDLSNLIQYVQWARFDSRLSEILVSYLIQEWKTINPVELNQKISNQIWNSALGVLLEFVGNSITSKNDIQIFRYWKKIATHGIPKANNEQFFIGLKKLAGKSMLESALFPLQEYTKWGYLELEILYNKSLQKNFKTHHLSPSIRKKIISELVKISPRLSAKKYWLHIEKAISLRQAERDLKNFRSRVKRKQQKQK